jgi:hypothetical protein
VQGLNESTAGPTKKARLLQQPAAHAKGHAFRAVASLQHCIKDGLRDGSKQRPVCMLRESSWPGRRI